MEMARRLSRRQTCQASEPIYNSNILVKAEKPGWGGNRTRRWRPVFYIGALLAFVPAMFLAWRDQYRSAHPYEKETYERAKATFDDLSNEEKQNLEELCIFGSIAIHNFPEQLESTGFVHREATTAYTLRPQYETLVPQLVKEWRRRPLNTSTVQESGSF